SMEFFLSRNKKRLSEIAKVMTYGEYCDKYTAGKRIKLKSCLYRDLRVYKLRAFFDYNLSYEQIMASVGKNVRIFTPPHIVDQSGVYGVTSKKLKPNELMVVIDLSLELTEQFKSAQAFLREVVKELKSEDKNYVRRKMKVENPLVVAKTRFDVYAVGKALRFVSATCYGYKTNEILNQ
ncbi:MAG: hypothetical protein NT086_21120, partial [Proteobacteria bacterium]|nr:hypothetical protein [Pseudomonadota bacterium]